MSDVKYGRVGCPHNPFGVCAACSERKPNIIDAAFERAGQATPPDPKDSQAVASAAHATRMLRDALAERDMFKSERDQLRARVQELESQLLQMAGTQAAGLAREEKLFKELEAAHAEADKWQSDWAKQLDEAVSLRARALACVEALREIKGGSRELRIRQIADDALTIWDQPPAPDAGTRALAVIEAVREYKLATWDDSDGYSADERAQAWGAVMAALAIWDQGAKPSGGKGGANGKV